MIKRSDMSKVPFMYQVSFQVDPQIDYNRLLSQYTVNCDKYSIVIDF